MKERIKYLVDKLERDSYLNKKELVELLNNNSEEMRNYLFSKSEAVRKKIYGNSLYIRGLIEFTNYCKNDCYYCGIRKSNKKAERYRLSKKDILNCCHKGYILGFRTFVLQGGEDPYYQDEDIVEIVREIKGKYPDCAITLSIGEKSKESYKKYFAAGADRYLLRQETADKEHYSKLHPPNLSLKNRMECLYDLKEIGYEVGCGFMVGSPYQSLEVLAEDLLFIHKLQPQMVGLGPFIPHKYTPFAVEKRGNLELTILLIGIVRLLLPNVLLPVTTALGTIDSKGREKGIMAGANVVMPNLSPLETREKYLLYDNKICTGDEAAECLTCIKNRIKKLGYEIKVDRGDCKAI